MIGGFSTSFWGFFWQNLVVLPSPHRSLQSHPSLPLLQSPLLERWWSLCMTLLPQKKRTYNLYRWAEPQNQKGEQIIILCMPRMSDIDKNWRMQFTSFQLIYADLLKTNKSFHTKLQSRKFEPLGFLYI